MLRGIFFFKDHGENVAGRLLAGLILFFEKASYEVKTSGPWFSLNIS